ncbi:common central domain of tyrosinase-domain-containing protein [Phaeosphaeriaceae sp. PMI808]|nr:common central domain of tyrosinase-domain-containing protein [Phaeosphaeriaceae sp. PMI808]
MKSFSVFFTSLTATLSLSRVSHAASSGASCGVAKADDSFFSVVGVQGTGVHPRQDLRELEKDAETWNMFLQALARFQAMDQSEKISYYQIAGIHGAPFNQWDRVNGQSDNSMKGYCPHASSLFGSWHRPYLALFEQILHDRAVDIANEYPAGDARDKATQIANKVRLPYWDWAVDPPNDQGSMPGSLRRPMVKVTFPNGTIDEINNPLYRYNFHPLKFEDFSPLSEFQFKNWNHTIRYPLDGFAINATSRDDDVNARVGKQQPNLRDMLYKLLTIYQPFNQVSNKANGGSIGNFETLHDGLHNVFGLGHMGIVEVSAFDPIFWLHHCNIDRIIALYQYRYPDTWVESASQAMGTFTMAKGSAQGADSPLAPFHMNADGHMWTSATSRNWTSFGYTYPELMKNPSNETFTATLNKLYKPKTQGLNSTIPTLPTPGNGNNKTVQATDWLCEVNMPTDIKISYSVRAFLGEPPSDPKKWPTDPNYVGQLASMSSSRMKTDIIVTGSIVLTEKLAQKHKSGDLKSLSKEDVTAYLKANFNWRIQALDFTEIPRDNPPAGLNVTVFNVPVKIPTSDTEVPVWNGQVEYNTDIDGNPPVYNGPGIGGTNVTAPVNGVHGVFNGTSGEYEWRNGSASAVVSSRSVLSATRPAATGGGLSLSRGVGSVDAPRPTSVVGPRTRYVTSIVVEYVTV